MALSAHEREIFEELVGHWAEDEERRRARHLLRLALVGFVVDLVLVLLTLSTSVWLAAGAYALMLGSVFVAERSLRVLFPLWWERLGPRPSSARLS